MLANRLALPVLGCSVAGARARMRRGAGVGDRTGIRAQVHPIALTRLGLILQDADAADAHAKPVGWVRAPAVCVGPPDADGCCMAVALPGERRARKHPVTGAPLFSSHNGVLNPFGAPRGLFRAAVEASQVHSARTGYHDSATLSVGRHDASVLVGKLKPEWDERDRVVWSLEGIPDEIIRA